MAEIIKKVSQIYEIENIGGFNKGPYQDERNLVTYNIGSNLSSVNFNYDAKNLKFQKFWN